ncbi:MAG: diguanylate cyclase [Kangiellaceae bacterium]|nr:diguanylate cyclase [Kangiellaceae bacterium]
MLKKSCVYQWNWLIGSCVRRLCLVSSLGVFGHVSAEDYLTNYTDEFQPLAAQLFSNPDRLSKDLALLSFESSQQTESAQKYLLLGLANNKLVLPEEALIQIEQGFEQLAALNQPQPWLKHSFNLAKASSFDLIGDSKQALPLVNKALDWAENNSHQRLYIQALVMRGVLYNNLSDSAKALADTQLAYSLAPVNDGFVAKGYIAGFIALVYEYRREAKLSIPYFEEAVAYHREYNRWRDLGDVIYGLGRANRNLGNVDLGHRLIKESVEIARRVNDFQGVGYGLKELASIVIDGGDIEQAEHLYLEALTIFEQSENIFTLSDVLLSLANLEINRDDLQAAEKYLAQVENKIKSDSMNSYLFKLHKYRANIYERRGEFEKAYYHIKEGYPPQLNLLRKQYTEHFEHLKNQFELDKRDSQNRLLQQENIISTNNLEAEKRKSHLLYLLIGLVIVICILLSLILYRAKQSKREFEKLSQIDELTKLPNRRRIMDLLSRQVDFAHRDGVNFSLAVIDMDFFKKINDHLGHSFGDEVLCAFADLCMSSVRKTDILGRIGGEEFLIAFPQTSVIQAKTILDKLRVATELIAKTTKLKDLMTKHQLTVSISIGVAELRHTEMQNELMSRADSALYQAKNNGRNRIAIAP